MTKSLSKTAITLLIVGIMAVLVAQAAVGSAEAAQTTNSSSKAPYYETVDSGAVDNETWMEDNQDATLENSTNMLTRVGAFVIGSQPGSTADEAAGALVLGGLIFGGVVGLVGGSDVGVVAGGVLGTTTIAGLVVSGLAPQWLWALVLFLLGTIVVGVYLRIYR